VESLGRWFERERSGPGVDRLFAGFTGWAPEFRERAGRAMTEFGTADAPASVPDEPTDAEEPPR
jgi:hypothetical protein